MTRITRLTVQTPSNLEGRHPPLCVGISTWTRGSLPSVTSLIPRLTQGKCTKQCFVRFNNKTSGPTLCHVMKTELPESENRLAKCIYLDIADLLRCFSKIYYYVVSHGLVVHVDISRLYFIINKSHSLLTDFNYSIRTAR